MRIKKKWLRLLLAILLVVAAIAYVNQPETGAPDPTPPPQETVTPTPSQAVTSLSPSPSQATLPPAPSPTPEELPDEESLDEDGAYTSKEDVALYIHLYGRLPSNFITKKEARELGWPGGSLEPYAPGMCIGGDRFGNYEGLLPEEKGRSYTECDIDTLGGSERGAKRIVFSNDGLIYYTDDHYASFELLYG